MGVKQLTSKEEYCTGCKVCQLICAWTFEKEFNPDAAYINVRVEEKSAKHTIEVTDKCRHCGVCVKYCFAQALELKVVTP